MSLCLVTGGAGFVGSHLVESLLNQGHSVRVLDNLRTGSEANLVNVRRQIDFVFGSVTDANAVQAAMAGVEWVFHLAALPSVAQSVVDPISIHEICATGTLRVLDAARQAGVRRVVYAASSSAYGDARKMPIREEAALAPLSPYGAAKLAGEHYCTAFTRTYGLETVRLRFFNIYGPRQDPHSPYAGVIPLFVTAMSAEESPTIFGDGTQTRDFVHVTDAVQALLLAAQVSGVAGSVFNIAWGKGTSISGLVRLLNRLLGKRIVPTLAPARKGDILHSRASIAAARHTLGYEPKIKLEEGLRHLVEGQGSSGRDRE